MTRIHALQVATVNRPNESPAVLDTQTTVGRPQPRHGFAEEDGRLAADVRQAARGPCIEAPEEFALARKVREHREACISLMLRVDPILFQLAGLLERVAEGQYPPARVFAPSAFFKGKQAAREQRVRAAIETIRRYKTLKHFVAHEN